MLAVARPRGAHRRPPVAARLEQGGIRLPLGRVHGADLTRLGVGVVDLAVVVVWGSQLIRDQQRPVDQRWVPRHWPAFVWLQGALVVATVPMIFLLGE
jgi:hypothetical protein